MKKIFRNSNFKPAFTLAEVLITLTIIGVIAAMVIPNLWQRHFEAETVSKLKKTYSVLNNAVMLAIRENGKYTEWGLGEEASRAGAENFYKHLQPYLKIKKDCGSSGDCFGASYRALMGNEAGWQKFNTVSTVYKITLDDGVAVGFYAPRSIFVDLNNKKGPNRIGVDLFMFSITEKNLLPMGTGVKNLIKSDGSAKCKWNDFTKFNGHYCGAHVIYKGNMDYLRRDISSDWP